MVGMGTFVMSLPLSSGLVFMESSAGDVGSWMTNAFIVDGSVELMVLLLIMLYETSGVVRVRI